MLETERSIWIDAPPEQVFAYMDVPEHQRKITPAITDIREVSRLENGGARADYTYRMLGVPLRGSVRALEHEPERRIVFEMEGGVQGRIVWTFEPERGGTRVGYRAEYRLPLPAGVRQLVGSIVDRPNARQVELTLENLRGRMENGEVWSAAE